MRSRSNSEYACVTEVFKILDSLDKRAIEYRWQHAVIIARCLPVADHIARRFDGRGIPFEDLVQVARVGPVQAVNRYDTEIGADFLPFAVPTMMGAVRSHRQS